jgi:hypothetical protein
MWATMASNFGGNQMTVYMTGKMKFATFKWTVFFCLLSGSLVWISYRASLTSELSVTKQHLPFNDLETLSETDFT